MIEKKTPADFRKHIQTYFANKIVASAPTFASELDSIKFAQNLEIGIYNYAIREATEKKIVKSWKNPYFRYLYRDRLQTIYFNLTSSIIQQFLEGEQTPQSFVFLTHQEMRPELWKELLDKKQKRENSQTTVRHSTTDLFTCRKCSSKHCTYYELQIRSADEPATVFVSCLDCGKHWRM
jgi:transcription elongation factor S-II